MDIYNELNSYGIKMTSIFVGQEELLNQKNSFVKANQKQIVGRFMVHQYRFRGISTLEDFKECLKGYDEDCEYPINSGISFSNFYFPDAYKDNKHLLDIGEMFFNTFQKERIRNGVDASLNIPMLYFALTIEYLFKIYGINGEGEYWINKEQCRNAIRNSGIIILEAFGVENSEIENDYE
jgi:hypothetical protein